MSAELREWFAARRNEPVIDERALEQRCTAAHPNHEWNGQIRGEPLFWQAWCTICTERRYLAEDSYKPNPEMAPKHLAAARTAAQAEFASRRPRSGRVRKPRCVCPTCGTEHIIKAGAQL